MRIRSYTLERRHTINTRVVGLVSAAALFLFTPQLAHGQEGAGSGCPAWVAARGIDRPEDGTLHRCNLHKPPVFLGDLEALPQPIYARNVHASLLVFVDSDGSVNQDLTRYTSVGPDPHFLDRMLAAITAWKFAPGLFEESPVRTEYELVIFTDVRADTHPETLRWTLHAGGQADTLLGTWATSGPAQALSRSDVIAAVEATTSRLIDMQVIAPSMNTYCLVPDDIIDLHRAPIRQVFADHLFRLGPEGCEGDPANFRYKLTDFRRTEGGRVRLTASGDFLPAWPLTLRSRPWPNWIAECVVPDVESTVGFPTKCDVHPLFGKNPLITNAILRDNTSPRGFFSPTARVVSGSPEDPISFLVEALATGSFRRDTIYSRPVLIPDLSKRAVLDSGEGLCGGPAGGAWTVITEERDKDIIVVRTDIPTDKYRYNYTWLTRPSRLRSPEDWGGSLCNTPPDKAVPFAIFFLGGLGETPTVPVTYCIKEPGCSRRYIIQPEVHELLPEPQLRIRIGDIRETAREGRDLRFQMTLNREVDGLIPLVVFLLPAHTTGGHMTPVEPGVFSFSVSGHPYTDDTEILIYLARVMR